MKLLAAVEMRDARESELSANGRDSGNALLMAAARIEATELFKGVRHLQPKGREQQSRRRSPVGWSKTR